MTPALGCDRVCSSAEQINPTWNVTSWQKYTLTYGWRLDGFVSGNAYDDALKSSFHFHRIVQRMQRQSRACLELKRLMTRACPAHSAFVDVGGMHVIAEETWIEFRSTISGVGSQRQAIVSPRVKTSGLIRFMQFAINNAKRPIARL